MTKDLYGLNESKRLREIHVLEREREKPFAWIFADLARGCAQSPGIAIDEETRAKPRAQRGDVSAEAAADVEGRARIRHAHELFPRQTLVLSLGEREHAVFHLA